MACLKLQPAVPRTIGERRYPKGSRTPDPQTYMTDDEVVAKFLSNTDGVLPRASAERIAEQVLALEAVEDFSAIMRLTGAAA